MEQTLFETSFIYDDVFYERQLISPFFIPYLSQLLHLFKILKINFRLKKFNSIGHFEAVFTNKNFEIKEFGTSDKVLIFEKNCSVVKEEINYLQKQATWAKTIFLVPYLHTDNFEDVENLVIYKHENEILNILKAKSFHFALIVGVDKSILSKPLTNQAKISLFDFN
jgi:ferrochelatase